MATYSFRNVLVWDINPGGVVRTLRNGTVTVKNATSDAVVTTVQSDQNGLVEFTTTDVPTVYLVSPGGLTSGHITAASAIESAAGFTVSEDAAVAALVADPGSSTSGALSSTFGTKAELAAKADQTDLDDVVDGTTVLPYIPAATLTLPNPAYIAHRGGGGIAPEETMDAFRVSTAGGADGLEMDLQPLADGSLGLMHDATVDRTTDGTGNVSSFTAPAWAALNAAAKFPWNGKVAAPAMLPQVLGEFGGQVVLFIEPKNQTNAVQLMDACDKKQLKANVVLEISDPTVLATVKARGYKVYFWWGSEASATTAAIASAVSGGADYLGCDGLAFSDAKITELVGTGLPVIPYTINRRVTRDHLLGLGVKGFLSDNPVYLKGDTAQRTVDSWRQGVFGHGLNVNGTTTLPRVTSGALVLPAQTAHGVTVGEVCPLTNAAGSYTIDVDLGWETLPASGSTTTAVAFGIADDGAYSFSGAANSAPGCYEAYLRQNGQISLYRVPPGNTSGAVLLGTTQATAALTAGGFAHIKITVTPTTVRLQRTDGTTSDTGAIADSTYRGGYIALNKTGGADGVAQFKNLAIT